MRIASTMPEALMLTEIGERTQQHRVGMNLSQVDLAKRAGVSRSTVERLEAGNSVQLENLVRVLRALRLTGNLDQLIPEAQVRPIQLADSKVETRKRSRRRKTDPGEEQPWTWGDRK